MYSCSHPQEPKDILNDPSYRLSCIPFLHNGSSTLESTFSSIRASNRDTSLLLEKGILVSNYRASNRLTSSSSYSADHSTTENMTLFSSDFYLVDGVQRRKLWFDNLISDRMKWNRLHTSTHRGSISSFPSNMMKDNPIIEFLLQNNRRLMSKSGT